MVYASINVVWNRFIITPTLPEANSVGNRSGAPETRQAGSPTIISELTLRSRNSDPEHRLLSKERNPADRNLQEI